MTLTPQESERIAKVIRERDKKILDEVRSFFRELEIDAIADDRMNLDAVTWLKIRLITCPLFQVGKNKEPK